MWGRGSVLSDFADVGYSTAVSLENATVAGIATPCWVPSGSLD